MTQGSRETDAEYQDRLIQAAETARLAEDWELHLDVREELRALRAYIEATDEVISVPLEE